MFSWTFQAMLQIMLLKVAIEFIIILQYWSISLPDWICPYE